MTAQPPSGPSPSILAIPGRSVTPRTRVIVASLLCLPGCGPWAALFGRSLFEDSPWLYDHRWVTIEEVLFLGSVAALLTTPIALTLLVRNGRFVSPRLRWIAWVFAAAAIAGPLYFVAGALGVTL